MRTGCLLLIGLGSGVISLSTPGCGGKTSDAETRYYQSDATTTTGATTGTGGSDNTGAGGSGATGGGTGGTSDPDPTGGTGTTGSGGTTGGTGGSGPGDPGGSGATGGTGGTGGSGGTGGTVDPPRIDASPPGCPEMQPNNNTTCSEVAITCAYGNTICACINSGGGGGGNRRDAGMTTWTCGAAPTDAGRGGRG